MHTAVILSEEKDLLLLVNIPSGRKKSSGAISCAGSARDTAFLVRGKRARIPLCRHCGGPGAAVTDDTFDWIEQIQYM